MTEAEAVWDTSNLYTTGEVTLLSAVPEPSTLLLALVALGVVGISLIPCGRKEEDAACQQDTHFATGT